MGLKSLIIKLYHISLRPLWFLKQFLKSHPWFLIKLKYRQKLKYGFNFFQDHFHCLGLYSRRLGYFSQNGQDYFLDKKIFHGMHNGFFVDIGTFSPDFDNATYFFERHKNWKGLAIEPQIKHVAAWRAVRKTPIIHAAASSTSGTSNFIVVDHPSVMNYNAWSGLESSIANEKMTLLPPETNKTSITIPTTTVTEALEKFAEPNKIINYMSIDVEGHEMEVLKGIDFNKFNIQCIVIENDILPEGDPIIHNYMISKGYKYIARLTSDDIFIKI